MIKKLLYLAFLTVGYIAVAQTSCPNFIIDLSDSSHLIFQYNSENDIENFGDHIVVNEAIFQKEEIFIHDDKKHIKYTSTKTINILDIAVSFTNDKKKACTYNDFYFDLPRFENIDDIKINTPYKILDQSGRTIGKGFVGSGTIENMPEGVYYIKVKGYMPKIIVI